MLFRSVVLPVVMEVNQNRHRALQKKNNKKDSVNKRAKNSEKKEAKSKVDNSKSKKSN